MSDRSHYRSIRARRAALLLPLGSLIATALVLAPPASAATVDVDTGPEVAAAFASGCADGDTVRLTADTTVPDVELLIGCSRKLDLNGFDLIANNVVIATAKTFTVADTSTTDVLNSGVFFPSGGSGRPGIQTTGATLVLESGRISATAGSQAAGVGGAGAPQRGDAAAQAGTFMMTGGGLVTTGGAGAGGGSGPSGAGLGGGYGGSGGTIAITGGTVISSGATSGAAIGGGFGGPAGTITIGGSAVVQESSGGNSGAGIGSGQSGASTGSVTIQGTARVTISGGANSAAIGGGANSSGPAVTIAGSAVVDANGNGTGAGIGGGGGSSANSVTISGGTVTARGGAVFSQAGFPNGEGGAGIGGGRSGSGGTITISGDADVSAIGSGRSAGIGGGRSGGGGTISIGSSVPTKARGGTNVGAASEDNPAFGTTTVSGTVVLDPAPPFADPGGVRLLDSEGDEITVATTGVIRGPSLSADGTFGGGSISGAGQIQNNGAITLTTGSVNAPVKGNHYQVTFDTRGGSAAPGPVTVYAKSFVNGVRTFPADPTWPGRIFLGWNSAANGSGTAITGSSTLPGTSVTGTAVPVTAYAQWSEAAAITGAETASANVGSSFTYTPTISGTPAPAISSTALPAGLTLNTTTGVISGTPTQVGVTTVTLTAVNTYGTDTHTVEITVGPELLSPTIDGAATADGVVGQSFSYTPIVAGFPAPTVSSTALPAGLALNSSTGAITGTPTAAGVTGVTLTASNSQGSDSLTVQISVTTAPAAAMIDGAATADGVVGQSFSYTPIVAGFPAPTVSSSALPAGLSLNSSTGAITGTPTEVGENEVTLTATNSSGADTLTVLLRISAPALVTQVPTAVNGPRISLPLATAISRLGVRAEKRQGFLAAFFRGPNDVDGDCQDTRSEVLRQESTRAVSGACAVTAGRWVSRYDGVVSLVPSRPVVQATVPAAEAWESGARNWSAARREAFANDLTEAKTLVVTSRASAAAKGNKEPGAYLPTVGRCTYVAEWVAVKTRWGLSVDRKEKSVLAKLARSCRGTRVVTAKASVVLVRPAVR